jgi:6,7-dimethyl-8-ribityllumazine synthase
MTSSGVKVIEGRLLAGEHRFAIVASRVNDFITKRLVEAAVGVLERHGARQRARGQQVTIVWVPGGLEIPVTAQRLAGSGRYDAIICLGTVLRGETVHFEHVAAEVAGALAAVALATGVPVLHGVVAADDLEQAIQRSGAKAGNRGREAALAALEMADLFDKLKKKSRA